MKKSEWSKPEVVSLGVSKTMIYDTDHGLDNNHIHVCACGEQFETWQLAQEHEMHSMDNFNGTLIHQVKSIEITLGVS